MTQMHNRDNLNLPEPEGLPWRYLHFPDLPLWALEPRNLPSIAVLWATTERPTLASPGPAHTVIDWARADEAGSIDVFVRFPLRLCRRAGQAKGRTLSH